MPRKPRHKLSDAPQPEQTAIAVLEPELAVETASDPNTEYVERFTGSKVAPERKATIYSCVDHAKMSPTEIARRLSMDVRTVNAVLANRDADAIEARNYLAANVLQAAEDWVTASKEGAKKGKHAPAKDLLLHTKVIEPIQDMKPAIQVAIVVGRPRDTSLLNPPEVLTIEHDTDS